MMNISTVLLRVTGVFAFALMLHATSRDAVASGKAINEVDLPIAVRKAFAREFPTCVMKKITKEPAKKGVEYVIESLEGMYTRVSRFSPDGTLLATRDPLMPMNLPQAVRQAMMDRNAQKKSLGTERVKGFFRVTQNGVVTYEVQISGPKGNEVLRYTSDGTPLPGGSHK